MQKQSLKLVEVGDRELVEVDDRELIEERNKAVCQIHRDMVSLNELFRDMDILVCQQGEMVDNIESSLSRSVANSGKGVEELRQAETTQTSDSSCLAGSLTGTFIAGLVTAIILL